MDESSRTPIASPVVRALQRAPYVIAFFASVALLTVWDTTREVSDQQGTKSWLNWIVLGYTVYGIIALLILVPRVLAPQFRRKGVPDRLIPVRFAFAVAPALVGIALSQAGADVWTSTLTLVVSISSLFIVARATATTAKEPTA